MARCARLPLSGFVIGHTFGVRVQRGRLTALRAEGCGRLSAAGCVPTGETTHYDLCVASAPSNHVRCASLRSGGDSGFAAEGGGGALRAQIIKNPARALRHFDRSGAERNGVEKSPPSDGTGGITAGDLQAQSIIRAVCIYPHTGTFPRLR